MLVLGRKVGQGVYIGRDVFVVVSKVEGDGTVRLAFEAPPEVVISRNDFTRESHLQKQDERDAVTLDGSGTNLDGGNNA